MRYTSTPPFACWVWSVFIAVCVQSVHGDDRTTWIYTDKGETRVYTKLASGDWVGTHPTKEPARLSELERNQNQVLLQNQSSKLIIRLAARARLLEAPDGRQLDSLLQGSLGQTSRSNRAGIASID